MEGILRMILGKLYLENSGKTMEIRPHTRLEIWNGSNWDKVTIIKKGDSFIFKEYPYMTVTNKRAALIR